MEHATCKKCGHTWLLRKRKPIKCPRCTCVKWDTYINKSAPEVVEPSGTIINEVEPSGTIINEVEPSGTIEEIPTIEPEENIKPAVNLE